MFSMRPFVDHTPTYLAPHASPFNAPKDAQPPQFVFLRGLNENDESTLCTDVEQKGHRFKGSHIPQMHVSTKTDSHAGQRKKSLVILRCHKKSTYTDSFSHHHFACVFPCFHTHTHAHTAYTCTVSDSHNSKVTGALERVVSYHTSVVQHSSQVSRDAVGSAC